VISHISGACAPVAPSENSYQSETIQFPFQPTSTSTGTTLPQLPNLNPQPHLPATSPLTPHMAGPNQLRHCGMCAQAFTSRGELKRHMQNHDDSLPGHFACSVCPFTFSDSLALEHHKIQARHGERTSAGASTSQIACDRCPKTFKTPREYSNHRKFPNQCSDMNFKKQAKKSHMGYVDLDHHKETVNDLLGYGDSSGLENASVSDSDTPSDVDADEPYCNKCKTRFVSKAQLNGHWLRCVAAHLTTRVPIALSKTPSVALKSLEAMQPPPSPVRQQIPTVPKHALKSPKSLAEASRPMMPLQTINNGQNLRTQAAPPRATAPPTPEPATTASGSSEFPCGINGCEKVCKSEIGLKVHKADVHGVGGKAIDQYGKDAWMLNQRNREQLRAEGLLRTPPLGPARGRGGGGGFMPPPITPMATFRNPQAAPSGPRPTTTMPPPAAHYAPVMPTEVPQGGVDDMELARYVNSKILRLLIQSDIFIHHAGKMEVCGINWTRIPVAKQYEVISALEGMIHLPKALQGEFVPPPKAFLGESKLPYPFAEFQSSPARNSAKPAVAVVAISCAKVVLTNGLQEVVKVAVVDVITCRILLNHLVCTDPKAIVSDWRSASTGMFSWKDMEEARKQGYKVLKGWSSARSALFKFIDKDTIILGHNLRFDLDSLRIVHGRAVDIAKVMEKAAKGPLSKAQLNLDSLSRDYTKNVLKSDAEYGRDCMMNAFAIRELGLWSIKNRDKLDKDMKQKSISYQTVMPRAAVAA
jgi:hypothetical protein